MISPDTITLVKERTDIVALIGENVRLTRKGRSFLGLCPFHKEKTPSFSVNPETGFYYCFGCKEHGSAIDFLMKIEGQSFTEAVQALADRAGIQVAETATDAERREAHAARKAKDDLYTLNNLAATFFEHSLHGGRVSPPHPLAHYAWDELKRRGLAPPQDATPQNQISLTLQAFRIGYAPYGWDGLLTFLKHQGASLVQAEQIGLITPRTSGSGHYDRFRHRLMFAVVDVLGRVTAFSGRALPEPTPDELRALGLPVQTGARDAPAKYMNSPESRIYTKGAQLFGIHQARQTIRQKGEAILVEGNFDVVALHARAITDVVAPLGTAFTEQQAKLIKRFAPGVVLLFDGDTAGRKATEAARKPCDEAGLSAKVAVLPKGMDPDELVRQKGPEAIEHLVKSARSLLQYLIDDALDIDKFKASTLTEQHARLNAVAELLRTEHDSDLRLMAKTYADQLASKLMMDGRSVADLGHLTRMVVQATSQVPAPALPPSASSQSHERARSRDQTRQIALEMAGAVIEFPELLLDSNVTEALDVVEGDIAMTVAALRQHWGRQKRLVIDEFLAQIPPSIHSFAATRLASPVFDTASAAKANLLENAQKLSRQSLVRENAADVEQLRKGSTVGDIASEDSLLRAVQRRALRKHGLS